MTRVETIAVIGDDRTMTLSLPGDIVPGKHRVVVLVDSPTGGETKVEREGESCDDYLVWEGDLLVYAGDLMVDPKQTLREIYRERERRFLYGPWE